MQHSKVSTLKTYRTEVIFFAALFVYYLMGVIPDMTFVSQGGDGFDYVVGSQNMWAVRPTGYPILIMLGWFFEKLPGNAFWNLGLLSAISSWITCIFIFKLSKYLIKQYNPDSKWTLAPYIAALTYAASFLVWTQSGIPEVYTLCTMLTVMAIYFALQSRWLACSIVLAVGVGTHHLIAFTVFALGAYAIYRHLRGQEKIKLWLYPLIICLGFLAYLQTILPNGPKETTSGLVAIGSQSSGSIGFVFGLPLTETWNRIKEAVPILLTGLGIGYVVLPMIIKKQRLPIYLIWSLVVIHFAYYFFSNIPMWVVYLVPAFAFGAVLVGYGVSKLKWKLAPVFFVLAPLVFMVFNIATYDIGNTIDKSPTGARRMYTQLDTVPDGAILYLDRWGEPWLETYYYWVHNPRFNFLFEGELRFHPESYVPYKEESGFTIPRDGDDITTMFLKYGNLSENTLYYTSWNREIFLEDLCTSNPGVPIYTVTERTGTKFDELNFTFGPYNCSEEVNNESTTTEIQGSIEYYPDCFVHWPFCPGSIDVPGICCDNAGGLPTDKMEWSNGNQ